MEDHNTTLQQLKNTTEQFCKERDWNQFYALKNCSIDIIGEAAELLEYFRWCENSESLDIYQQNKEKIEHEIADILFGIFKFCLAANIDLSKIYQRKMALNALKYPVDKCKGKAIKYTEL